MSIMTPTKLTSAEAFRQNLRRRIDELDISDAEVARRAGMHPQLFWKYINGKSNPGIEALDRIAEAVEMSAGALITPAE